MAILLAWVGMMTLFPAVLMLVDRRHADRPRQRRPRAHQLERIRVPLLDRLVTFPRSILIGAGVATALAIWTIPRVGFDYNVLNLQAKGTESVAWERRILAGTGRSGFNGLSSAASLDELRRSRPPSRSCRRCPTWTPCSGSSPTSSPRRSRSSRASRPWWPRSASGGRARSTSTA